MQPSILHYETYKKISDQIKRKDILAEIHFAGAVADIFHRFLLLFQKDEPLIHTLHSECVSLDFTIMGEFLNCYMKSWLHKSYLVPELHVVTNYMRKNLFSLKIVKVLLMYFSQNINQEF